MLHVAVVSDESTTPCPHIPSPGVLWRAPS